MIPAENTNLITFTIHHSYRKCASTDVLHYGEKEEICKFMGQQEKTCKKENGSVSKLQRKSNRHVLLENITHELLSLLASNNVSADENISRGTALTTNDEVVNAGDWVEYQTSQGEVLVLYCFSH